MKIQVKIINSESLKIIEKELSQYLSDGWKIEQIYAFSEHENIWHFVLLTKEMRN